MSDPIYITHGFPENQRRVAAEIYFNAFQQKIGWLLEGNKKGSEFIEKIIRPECSICAMKGKGEQTRLVGLSGFKTTDASMIGGTFSDIVRNHGFFSSLWRAPLLSLLERNIEPGVLLMDGIAVSPDLRGKGIGTKLLKAMAEYARNEGFHSVRLDVISSNPRAQALYEIMGFKPVGGEYIGSLKYLFGFLSSTKMALDIKETENANNQSKQGKAS